MAEVDLDGVIRSIAKKQHKIVMDAARKRHGRLMGMAAKAKDKAAKARYKHLAKNTLLLAGAAARRLQITAENAADSYARAIKKATELKPDLVVMDLAMPLMNGLEAANILKSALPGVPIVLLTLYAEQLNGPKSSAFGIATVLSKVDGLAPLLECLERFLGPSGTV